MSKQDILKAITEVKDDLKKEMEESRESLERSIRSDIRDVKSQVNALYDHLIELNKTIDKLQSDYVGLHAQGLITDASGSKFRNDLSTINWHNVLSEKSADVAYDNFLLNFDTIYEHCFPYNKVILSRKCRKTWMNRELLCSIKRRHLLHNKFLGTRNKQDLADYKQFLNVVNKQLKDAKKCLLHAIG